MNKNLWINLPVEDMGRAKRFYNELGFEPNLSESFLDDMTSFLIAESHICLNLIRAKNFEVLCMSELNIPLQGNQILLGIEASSRKEIIRMEKRIPKYGGSIFQPLKSSSEGFLVLGFSDPDGHRWRMTFVDYQKLSK